MAFDSVGRFAMLSAIQAIDGRQMGGETSEVIWSWAVREVAPWTFKGLQTASTLAQFEEINRTFPQAYVFEIIHGRVCAWPKPDAATQLAIFKERGEMYRKFFQNVVDRWRPELSITFCMSLADGKIPSQIVPTFTFQKVDGDEILLPDIDFMFYDFYNDEKFADTRDYQDKASKAAFVGSTTGAILTSEMVKDKSLPRLNAAEYFYGSPIVEFRLPSVVQYENDEVRSLLMELPYCRSGAATWESQLENKFLISMDGNGATCSRVLLAIRSNSVLLKYESSSILYYSQGLTPWTHYVPIHKHSEVEDVVQAELVNPGSFAHIARAGSLFEKRYLNRDAVEYYTAALLMLYQGCFILK